MNMRSGSKLTTMRTDDLLALDPPRYQFELDRSSRKFVCPKCGKVRFVRFVDTVTGEYLPEQYGSCDRKVKCGHDLNPYNDGYSELRPTRSRRKNKALQPPKTLHPIPKRVLEKTLKGYEINTFVQALINNVSFPFEVKDVERVIAQYYLGTIRSGYRKGATTFPFIDVNNNVRAIQVKQFDFWNHTTGTGFLHSMVEKSFNRKNKPLPKWLKAYNENESKVSCLFGEHLINKYPDNPIGLVEAPKTAIYSTLYLGFPDQPKNLLWLAVFNLSSLNLSKCKALKGRNVYLFPDLSKNGRAFKSWSAKAREMQRQMSGTNFYVSDLLERSASDQDREQGKDLADYLIKMDWRQFRNNSKSTI